MDRSLASKIPAGGIETTRRRRPRFRPLLVRTRAWNVSSLQSRCSSGGGTRANNALLALGAGGQITVSTAMSSGSTDFLVDVTGYFQ
ncbi:MAG TPA: hypothetical protein VNJ70_04530 [Thermoanaerobaculia bacterium]|nr:hypothetical protein [Thermoanaerobaculia bacterium]